MAFIGEWYLTTAAIRILYVDDEPGLLEIGKMFLEMSGDFSVNPIDSASAALELLKKEQFDAIISDYQMPGMDGIQFLIEVRTRFGQIPFILFTGRGREEIVLKAINSGADLYLQKGGETGAQYAELAQKTRIVVERHAAVDALKKSEEKYRSLIEHADEAIVVAQEGMLRLVNKRAIELIGYPEQKLQSMLFTDVIHPDDRAMVAERYQKRMKGEEVPSRYAFRISPNDGSVRWVEISAVVIDWDRGPATLNFLTDITERKRAEDALQTAYDNLEVMVQERTADLYSANMKLRKAIEYSNVITESLKEYANMTSALNEVIITANRADTLPNLFRDTLDKALAMMDFEAGGIYLVNPAERNAGIHYYKNLPDEFIEKSRTIPIDAPPYDTLFVKNQPFITEHFEKLSPEFAEKYHFRSLASIPLVSKNKVIGALNVVSTKRYSISADETKMLTAIGCELGTAITRMIAEEEVKKISVNLQTLFASVNEMIFVLDMQGRIISVNDSVLKRLLYTPAELTGMDVLLLHVPERRDEALQIIQGMIAGTINSCPVPLISKDGTRIEVETTVTRGLWNSEEVVIGVTRDVTERKQAEEILKSSEIRYRRFFEAVRDGILIINAETGTILDVNPFLIELLGYSHEQFLGKKLWEIGIFKDIAASKDNFKKLQEQKYIRFEDLPLETADGRLIYSEFVSFVYDVDGKNVMQCNIRDITERKLAEEALHESEDKYRSLVSNIPGIVYRCANDSDWTMHYISEEIKQVSDYPASDFINNAVRSYASIIHPDDRDLVDRSVQKGLTEKAIFSMEYRICRADGSIRWVHEQGQGVFAHDGNLLWMDGVILDQTERKTVEEALAVSEIKYRTLFDNSSDAILIHDMTGRILDVNQVLCDRLGYSRHELLQMTPLDFDSPEYAELVTERIGQLMRNKHQMFETCNVRKDGTRIPTEINLRIIEYEGQQACLCVGRDITERKMDEVAIRLANKKLALLSSITRHDINNQLTVVMGYLSILEKEQPDPTLNNYFVKVSNAAQRISSMIQFASEYEKIGVSAPVWQDPRTLVDTAAKDVLFGKVIVRNDLQAGMEVFADPLIVKVCYNLMDNAVRYGKKITTIRFSYEEAGEDHLIVCENDGDGIVAEEKEKIFERGFGKNTGLGLFLSREILSITGITLRETGEPGKGARFEMMVPKEAWRFTQKN